MSCELHLLGFVHCVSSGEHRLIAGQVGKRFSQQPPKNPGDKAKAKRLTSEMKQAESAMELIDLLDVAIDCMIFNFFHASAAYTQLATLKRKGCLQPSNWDAPVLSRLHARVQNLVVQDQLNAQSSANVLWSIAQLSDQFSTPNEFIVALVKSIPAKVRGMKPQELSNCLWACAKLKDCAPDVQEAVQAIAA